MIDQAQTDKLKEIIDSSQSISLIFPVSTNLDIFLASYSFYIFLSTSSDARLLSPKLKMKLPNSLLDLVETKKIETELGRENLLVSFPYQSAQVDNVSYYIGEQTQRFYLTIKPKKGIKPLDSSKVEFAYTGSQADLVILCGVENLESLEQLYFGYENLYKATNNYLVTINNFIPDFGKLNLDISPSSSYCEAVFYLLKDLTEESENLLAKSQLPTLLLYGIESQTQALQNPATTANTFLAVADLLRLGAVRLFKPNSKITKKIIK